MLLKSNIFLILLLTCIPDIYGQQDCIEGKVTDSKTEETIPYASIRIVETRQRTICDSLGNFSICGIRLSTFTLEVSHVSYQTSFLSLQKKNSHSIQIKLKEKEFITQTVDLEGYTNKQFNSNFTGNQILGEKDFLKLPSILGEADVLKAVQLLPGIQSVSEGNNGVFVRGGSPGQNLFLLDEMELMNPSHLMGLYSVFNALTTDKVEVHKGHAPAQLQGRLSSSIEVQTKNPSHENREFYANIGNISSTIALSQATADDKLGITMGIRRSYLEGIGWIASAFIPDDKNYFKLNKYSFYDFNGKARFKISPASSLTLSWYMGKDQFNMNNQNIGYQAGTRWGNRSIALTYRRNSRLGITYSHILNYTSAFSVFDGNIIDNNIYFDSRIEQIIQKNQWIKSYQKHTLRAGIEFFYTNVTPQDLQYQMLGELIWRKNNFRNIGISTFGGDHFRISDKVDLYASLRLTSNSALHPSSDGNASEAKAETSDRQIDKTHFSWSPSIALSLFPADGHSIKAAYSRNVQQLHLASISSIPMPNDIWMSSSAHLKPEVSHQLSSGYYRQFNEFDASVEIYGKYLQNQLIYNAAQDQSVALPFEDLFFKGKGVAYGIDFSIAKKKGSLTGTLNYSLSRSRRSFPSILNGQWFNDKYDRIHDLNFNLSYRLNRKWELSALWIYATGSNLSLPSGRWWMMGSIMNDYDGYNNFRLPPYHRLDISASCHFDVKCFRESVLNFSVINLYNRANPYFVYYKVYMGRNQYDLDVKANQVSLFPILPSVSWRFKI